MRLNRSEKTYLAVEGIWGSLAQVYGVRFSAPVDPEAVRRALREVIRAHPRLRGVVERTLFGHRLRILEEGPTIDNLYEHAFRIWPSAETDASSLGPLMTMVMDEPFAIERDLPIKARFIPHPERPAVIVSMHHIAGDGRSVMAWMRSLHRALNGEALEVAAVDPPGYDAALLPRTSRELLPAFFGALEPLFERRASVTPLRAPRRNLRGFAPGAALPVELSAPAGDLVRAARARKTTLGTLLFAASALALRRLLPESERGPVRARLSIDLRDLFPEGRKPGDGNYVSSFLVDVEPEAGLEAMLPEIDAGMKKGIDLYERRAMFLVGFSNELVGLLGRKLYSIGAMIAKERGIMPDQSFHFSNVGRADGFDWGKVQIDAIFPSLPHYGLFIATLGFRGRLLMTLCYPRGEIAESFVRALGAEIDRILVEATSLLSVEGERSASGARTE